MYIYSYTYLHTYIHLYTDMIIICIYIILLTSMHIFLKINELIADTIINIIKQISDLLSENVTFIFLKGHMYLLCDLSTVLSTSNKIFESILGSINFYKIIECIFYKLEKSNYIKPQRTYKLQYEEVHYHVYN